MLRSIVQSENIAIKKHCPKRKNKPKDLNNPWWTSKLQNQRKKIKVLKKQNTLWYTEERQNTLREKKRVYKRDCLMAKKQDWKYFNTKQDSRESINTLRKILERKKSNTLGYSKNLMVHPQIPDEKH